MKRFLWLLFLTGGISVQCFGASDSPGQRPNFIFVYADDLRWDTIGVVQAEQGSKARFPWLKTPRLDEFARSGVLFRESFVVTSLCSPGRANVMTSRYGHLNGIIGNGKPLPVETVTVATQLKKAGYTTAYCGKWHMDGQRERPSYDFVASFVGQGRYVDCPLLINGEETPTKGWVDDVTTDYAIQFLQTQSKGKPFFLWLGFKSVHGPRGGNNLPDRARDLYEGEESRSTPNTSIPAIYLDQSGGGQAGVRPEQTKAHQDFMRHATAIDTCFGRLMGALEKSGQSDRTIVIFTSDNGYYLGEHRLGDKRSAYDESLRVPLLVRVPGMATARGVNDAMVLNIDYAPTILDFAGAAPLPNAQGRSLRPLLEGKKPADWRTSFFYEYFRERNFGAPTVLAVRTTSQKLITYPGHEEWTEVFDLNADPYETRNLVKEDGMRSRLQKLLDEQARAVGFVWPQGYSAKGDSPGGDNQPTPKKKKKGKKAAAE